MNIGKDNRTLCILQARMGSTRLPGKVLMEVGSKPLLEYELDRVRLASQVHKIVVATTVHERDDVIEALCLKNDVEVFRGSEDDVLDRYYQCSLQYPEYDTIVRITGDCPLIDPYWIDAFITYFHDNDFDYVNPSAGLGKETFPHGIAEIEVFTRDALVYAAEHATDPSRREHPTLFFTDHPERFKKGYMELPHADLAQYRLTVDYPDDFEVVKYVIENSRFDDGYETHIALLRKHPGVVKKNARFKRNPWWEKISDEAA